MKLKLTMANAVVASPNRSRPGFTLTNLLVSTTIFSLVLGSLMAAHLFGLRMLDLSQRQHEAGDTFTRSFTPLFTDVRSAKRLRLGNGNPQSFQEIQESGVQAGNALLVYPTRDTNRFVQYYLDAQDHSLKRLDPDGSLTVMAQRIANDGLFTAEDHAGARLTNLTSFAAIAIRLDVTNGSPTGASNTCTHLETLITSRLFE